MTLGRVVLLATPIDTCEFDKLEVRRHVPGRRIGFQPVREATSSIERPMTRTPGIISLHRWPVRNDAEPRRPVGNAVGHLRVRQTGSSSPRPCRRIGFQPVREATSSIERPMTRIPRQDLVAQAGRCAPTLSPVALSATRVDTWEFDKLEVRRHGLVVG